MTSHAERMDDVYRYQRYIYDFTRKYYLFGRDRLIANLNLEPGDRVIEIGCGTARNLIKIARAYPACRLFGLDASAEMLATAQKAVDRAGLTDRIVLRQAYAEALTPALFGETAAFDAALFSYSLSMIPDWKQALKSAEASLSPAGKLHVVDFGDLKGLSGIGERALRGWLGLFHVSPRDELLQTVEQKVASGNLSLLAGRYAFIWTAAKSNLAWD